jgi:ribosomal protein S18 acetylase RimI-like enzyme
MNLSAGPAQESDIDALVDIYKENHRYLSRGIHRNLVEEVRHEECEHFFRDLISRDAGNCLVCRSEHREALGYAILATVKLAGNWQVKPSASLYIREIFTKLNRRRAGVGTRLLEEAVKIAQNQNLPSIAAHVHSRNDAALKFYERLGFIHGNIHIFKKV